MIKKTLVILLAVIISMPMHKSNATVIMNQPEPSSTIKVEDTTNLIIKSPALLTIESMVQLKKEENEELKKQEEERKRIQAIIDENTRKNNVHIYAADVTSVSGITAEELTQVFYKIGKPKMAQYAQAFIDAEKEYKVNALFLAGIVAQESGWGSKAGGTNGSNLTGYAVYNVGYTGSTFNSGYEGILETAKLLKKDYLTPGAPHYHGVSVEDVNTDYCLKTDMKTTDYKWTSFVTSIENKLEKVYHHEVKTLQKEV